jgi:hypothetical protein
VGKMGLLIIDAIYVSPNQKRIFDPHIYPSLLLAVFFSVHSFIKLGD